MLGVLVGIVVIVKLMSLPEFNFVRSAQVRFRKIYLQLVEYSLAINTLFAFAPIVAFCTCLQLSNIENQALVTWSVIVMLALFMMSAGFTYHLFALSYRNQDSLYFEDPNLKPEEQQQHGLYKYRALWQNLNRNSPYAYVFPFVSLGRKLLVPIVLVLFQVSCIVQLTFLSLTSALTIVFLVRYKPVTRKLQHHLYVLLNELIYFAQTVVLNVSNNRSISVTATDTNLLGEDEHKGTAGSLQNPGMRLGTLRPSKGPSSLPCSSCFLSPGALL